MNQNVGRSLFGVQSHFKIEIDNSWIEIVGYNLLDFWW